MKDLDKKRPDPEALLKEVERSEQQKGKLKVFLGYAPGVGKTYTMLEEAHDLIKRNIDVVIGIVETHKRSEIEQLLKGLETIPRKTINYKNIILEEMDLDTILKRKPKLVLVDEAAHSNVSECRHPKRFQDIEEILSHGIDVYTTLNIQHLESFNDIISEITEIRVQETLPDKFLDEADEIKLVDLPIEDLFQRLREGKVYIPQQAQEAMKKFFRHGNLVALREISLRCAANKIDSELINYLKAHAIERPWFVSEKILVCIAPTPYSKQLVRRSYMLASETGSDWYAVYVSTPALSNLSEQEKTYLTEALNLAGDLGANVLTLEGYDIAEELNRFAKSHNITRIVMGKPIKSKWWKFLYWSPIERLIHKETSFDVQLITPAKEHRKSKVQGIQKKIRLKYNPRDYIFSFLMVVAITIINYFLEIIINPGSLDVFYLIAIISSALLFGTLPSLLTSIMSILFFDFFFVEPRYHLTIARFDELVNLLIFFCIAIVIGQLIKITKRQYAALHLRLERLTIIEHLSKDLFSLPSIDEVLEDSVSNFNDYRGMLKLVGPTILDEISKIIVKYTIKVVRANCVVMFRDWEGNLKIWLNSDPNKLISNQEIGIANWTFTHNEPAGSGTNTLKDTQMFFLPFNVEEKCIGVLGFKYNFQNLLPEQKNILSAICNLSALAAVKWITI